MTTDYYYCIKDYTGFNINFTAGKTYKIIGYLHNDINYIVITDDNNNELDINIKSMISQIFLAHFIPQKKLRKQKLNKLLNISNYESR